MKPAIIVSGHTMALGVVRALGEMGVPIILLHYDERDMAQVSRYVGTSICTPHPEKEEGEFIEKIVGLSDRYPGALLIPASDESLAAISRHKSRLEDSYTVACPDWEITRKFIDKRYTYALAESYGVPAPRTTVPESIQDVQDYADRVSFPCLVKPCQSHLFFDRFKKKMFRVENREQMVSVFRQAAQYGLDVMLQEIIPGDDSSVVNYNSYFWEGEPLIEFTAAQVRKAPPEFGSPRVVISKEIPEVIEPGRKILRAMGFYGYSCAEFKRDPRDGIYKIMEVNGRHNLSTLLAVRCGINFPWLQYRHLTGGDLPEACSYKKSVYWIDIPRDVGYSAMFFSRERYSVSEYLRPYLKPHAFAILDLYDPKPFVKRLAYLAGEAVRGWSKRETPTE